MFFILRNLNLNSKKLNLLLKTSFHNNQIHFKTNSNFKLINNGFLNNSTKTTKFNKTKDSLQSSYLNLFYRQVRFFGRRAKNKGDDFASLKGTKVDVNGVKPEKYKLAGKFINFLLFKLIINNAQ